MKKSALLILIITLLGYFSNLSYAEGIHLTTQTINGNLPITSWKTLRARQITKQQLDFSCGAASMATILHRFTVRPSPSRAY